MPARLVFCVLLAAPALVGFGAFSLSMTEVNTAKAVLATAATVLLGLRLLPRDWLALPPGWRRAWDGALLLAGVLGAAAWTNWGQLHYPGFGHPSETFHYFIGARYYPELGHTRLYRCVAVAEAEAGVPDVESRFLRDLESNSVVSARSALADPGACKDSFSEARWQAFARDVAWFRDRPTPRRWRLMQTDHGYNATPVWTALGGLVAGSGPATDGRIFALRLLDPLGIAAAWAAAAWVFGWRAVCVALVFWGTSYPSQYGWTGGAYLRQVELAAVIFAACCLARGRARAGGFLLALAALFRIYPALLFAGPALQIVGASLHARRPTLDTQQRQLVIGALLALVVALPLAGLRTGGVSGWLAFVRNSQVLLDTPLRNHLGLRTFLSHEAGLRADALADPKLEDPYQPWKEARQAAFEHRRPLFVALVAGYALLLGLAVAGQPLWAAVLLSAGLVPIALELTSYYAALLAVYGLVAARYPPVGVGLCALSAAGWALATRLAYFDVIFPWVSLATAAFVVFATVWAWRAVPVPQPTQRPDTPDKPAARS
jgi:hypothetical protein